MRKFFFSVCFLLAFVSVSGKNKVIVQNGVLDLRAWDWQKDGIINLTGDWEFYWNKFYSPRFFTDTSVVYTKHFAFVPSFWNKYIPAGDNSDRGFGYATYHIIVLCPPSNQQLALKFLTIESSYKLFINNKEILNVGQISTTSETTVADLQPTIVNVLPEDDKLEIIIQVANFNNRVGGLRNSIKLGTKSQIHSYFLRNLSVELLVAGGFLLAGIYYLILFLHFRKRYVLLYFSILCFIFCTRSLVIEEMPVLYISKLKWELARQAEYISFYLSVPITALFSYHLFPHEFSKKVLYIILPLCSVFVALSLFATYYVYTFPLRYYQAIILLTAFYGLYVYIKAAVKKRPGSFLFLGGFCLFLITVVNDVLYANLVMNTMPMFYIGLASFCIILSILLSRQFVQIFYDLQVANKKLSAANKELDIMNNEIKEKNEELSHEKNLLRTLIDNLPDYIYIKDTQSRHLINNKANIQLMGASNEEETIGKSVIDFFGPEIAKPFIEDDQRIIQTGMSIVNREETIVSSTGETKYLLTAKVPIKDKNNKVTGLVGISRDITKQKQMELDLRNSKYFLEKAQKVGQIGHWISDRLTGKLTWSEEACRIFGMDPYSFDGRVETFLNKIHPDDLEKVKSATAFAIEHNEAYSIDHRIILNEGTMKWVHEQGETIYDEAGKATTLIGIVQDITERKKIENEILKLNNELEEKVITRTEQLMAANEGLEAFSYSISHDLMTPLRAVSSYSGILKENYESKLDAQGNGLIDRIITNSKKMGQLIDDLLAFAKLGRQEVTSQHIDMKLLVESCIEELLHNYPENKFKIKVHSLPSCEGDAGMIRQVWINLLSNAFKYSSKTEEPKIEIGAIDNESMHIYFVRDNGVGFEMEYVHKLFGVFQRLHRHEEFEGTGVGLALVKRIINKHKGDVWPEASPGKGATFYFSLPVM